MPGAERVAGRLSTRDALEQAQRAQERYRAEHGTYTTTFSVLTEEGFYEGVSLEARYADEHRYCVEASHSSGVIRHITEVSERPRPGPCP
ncbi:MAG: type IV pilin protein [Actinomycetota bacterium]|nr:type IV pilin protein [Actinomycetota bacterium]